ncbi:hypothetical protein JXM67_01285 [candidate division WOR-3 bacterium]|nr:hypothetical protein [candidate division WOR-3 bacterium]
MRKITLFVLMGAFGANGLEIVWEKTYGESMSAEVRSVLEAFDGGYLALGSTASTSASSVWLFKTDTAGNVLWQKTYNLGVWDGGFKIIPTSDSAYLVVGFSGKGVSDGKDVYVLKVDTVGDTLWQRTYGGQGSEEAVSVIENPDGSFIIVGYTDSYPPEDEGKDEDIFVLKLDVNGDSIWQNHYGGEGWQTGAAVASSSNGYVIIGSKGETAICERDVYFVELDADGNLLWDDTYGGEGEDYSRDLVKSARGGYLIVGGTTSHRAEEGNAYVFEVNAYGEKLWERLYGGNEPDEARAVEKMGYKGYLVVGGTSSYGEGGEDVYILELDRDGNVISENNLGGENTDRAYCVTRIKDGYLVAGVSSSFGQGNPQAYLVKLRD